MSMQGNFYGSPGVNLWPQFTTSTAGQPPDPERDLAPGLTMKDLDALLRRHYAKGYEDGKRKAWADAEERIAGERSRAALQAESALLQWMWPNVMNRVLTASERAAAILDAPKSTIARDRESVSRILDVLKQSLHSFHQKGSSDG